MNTQSNIYNPSAMPPKPQIPIPKPETTSVAQQRAPPPPPTQTTTTFEPIQQQNMYNFRQQSVQAPAFEPSSQQTTQKQPNFFIPQVFIKFKLIFKSFDRQHLNLHQNKCHSNHIIIIIIIP